MYKLSLTTGNRHVTLYTEEPPASVHFTKRHLTAQSYLFLTNTSPPSHTHTSL